LIGDKAYDSDGLDEELAELGVEILRRTAKIASRKTKHRMDARYAVTSGAGKLNGSSPGCKTSGVCSPALTSTRRITWASFTSLASRFCSNAIYETTCIDLTLVTGTIYREQVKEKGTVEIDRTFFMLLLALL
jgi:hypothetical protein